MRLEATIADTRGRQLDDVIEELKVSRSQIVDEAISIFLKAFMETKRGHRLAIIDPETQRTIAEIASPALSQLEWATHRAKLSVSPKALKRVAATLKKPPEPTPALRRAMAQHR